MDEVLGTIFLSGKLINLDNSYSEDLEKYIEEAKNMKAKEKMELDKIAEKIRRN